MIVNRPVPTFYPSAKCPPPASWLQVRSTAIWRSIRFDFPLINDDSKASEVYEKGLDVTVEVRVPDSDRPNKFEIWDRANDKRWQFEYPPK